ncbi:DNA mismatch endonuclease Vsr [Mesorhizobium sp. M0187]|uniref:very short patch repair endonuclease n=1 Tax=unclassified Mesorhizobium TaxID=325217 RepID=UPI003335A9CA
MADRLSPERRSALMSKVRGKDTTPEMRVRRLLYAMGVRYRLHRRELPGSPDIVMNKRRKVIFVHGCFWHRHPGCVKASFPKSNIGFWAIKFDKNIERDELSERLLKSNGWETLTIWECETRSIDDLTSKLERFLAPLNPPS